MTPEQMRMASEALRYWAEELAIPPARLTVRDMFAASALSLMARRGEALVDVVARAGDPSSTDRDALEVARGHARVMARAAYLLADECLAVREAR